MGLLDGDFFGGIREFLLWQFGFPRGKRVGSASGFPDLASGWRWGALGCRNDLR